MRIGVDLGTTNTVAARDAEALTIPGDGGAIVPSVVAHPPNGKILVGVRARGRRAIDPANTIYSSKRLIGRRWGAAETVDFGTRYPFELIERNEHPCFKTRVGALNPSDIGATILRYLWTELGLSDSIASATLVVAVPAGFAAPHRDATRRAAALSGASQIELVEEPVATARAFAHVGSLPSGLVAVYDLGGGTFELAVIDADDSCAIVGSASELYLGGDDIDRALADSIADDVLESHRWDLRDDPIVFDRLVLAAEGAKRALSTSGVDFVPLSLSSVDPALPNAPETYSVSRTTLETVATPIIRRTFLLCDEALASAGVGLDELSAVLLAGGSSQLPLVSTMVGQYFDRQPERVNSPMELVAIGASIA